MIEQYARRPFTQIRYKRSHNDRTENSICRQPDCPSQIDFCAGTAVCNLQRWTQFDIRRPASELIEHG
jgi:hypothetical protein